MKKSGMLAGGLVLALSLTLAPGCSSSGPGDTPKVDGMTPAEYREKAELERQVPAKAAKDQGRTRRP